jgi:hypothetical protein
MFDRAAAHGDQTGQRDLGEGRRRGLPQVFFCKLNSVEEKDVVQPDIQTKASKLLKSLGQQIDCIPLPLIGRVMQFND